MEEGYMKLTLKRGLLAALLVAMVTTLTGCTFGRARISVEFIPDPLVIAYGEKEIVGDVTLTLDGLGVLTLNEIRLEFVDAEGRTIEGEYFPQGGTLPRPITLPGTLGWAQKTVPLKLVLGSEAVKINDDWWYPEVPHPTMCRVTFLSSSGKVVGLGSVGLKWEPW
jgi:hypothetical protein